MHLTLWCSHSEADNIHEMYAAWKTLTENRIKKYSQTAVNGT
jgi:hypothetical protein